MALPLPIALCVAYAAFALCVSFYATIRYFGRRGKSRSKTPLIAIWVAMLWPVGLVVYAYIDVGIHDNSLSALIWVIGAFVTPVYYAVTLLLVLAIGWIVRLYQQKSGRPKGRPLG